MLILALVNMFNGAGCDFETSPIFREKVLPQNGSRVSFADRNVKFSEQKAYMIELR